MQSLNIAIICIENEETITTCIQNQHYSIEDDYQTSTHTVLYFFLLMLYKVSQLKIF